MLEIKNLNFGYTPTKNVIQGLSLDYKENGVYGLLGKNGTGKSTLLYLIMGLLRPKSGEILFNGVDTSRRLPDTLADMFIVPEEYDLPPVTLQEYIKALSPLYPHFSQEMLRGCLDCFEMEQDVNLKALSMGQKKKIYMSVALATNARLMLMDEPTNGLDIPSKSQFRKVIAGNLDENQTVIISTHQVKDVELLLDHVTMIDEKKVLINDRIENLFTENEPVDLERLFNEKYENR